MIIWADYATSPPPSFQIRVLLVRSGLIPETTSCSLTGQLKEIFADLRRRTNRLQDFRRVESNPCFAQTLQPTPQLPSSVKQQSMHLALPQSLVFSSDSSSALLDTFLSHKCRSSLRHSMQLLLWKTSGLHLTTIKQERSWPSHFCRRSMQTYLISKSRSNSQQSLVVTGTINFAMTVHRHQQCYPDSEFSHRRNFAVSQIRIIALSQSCNSAIAGKRGSILSHCRRFAISQFRA